MAGNEAERERVEAAGAFVAGTYMGVDGAEGMLQVTRSLGDIIIIIITGDKISRRPRASRRRLRFGDAADKNIRTLKGGRVCDFGL